MIFKPISEYYLRLKEGWQVYISKELVNEHPEIYPRAIKLLRFRLFDIKLRIPRTAYEKLCTVPIWLEFQSESSPARPNMIVYAN
jgi:hypothetical protein